MICNHHERQLRALCCDLGLEAHISLSPEILAVRRARNDPTDIDPLDLAKRAVQALASVICRENRTDMRIIGCPLCFFASEARSNDWTGNIARTIATRVRKAQQQKLDEIERNRQLEADARSL